MGLFGGSGCPAEDNHLKEYGIPAPVKWQAEDCLECCYRENGKCAYKKIKAKQADFRKRGAPVLAKRARMYASASERRQAETTALRKAGFVAAEQQEYLTISVEIDAIWESTPEADRRDVLDRLDQWKMQLEKGLSPAQAYLEVQVWLEQREEFKKGSG
jgi:hypothetical protein